MTGQVHQTSLPMRLFAPAFLLILLAAGCSGYYQGPVSDHFDGSKFFNPWSLMPNRFGDFLKWRFSREQGKWPESMEVTTTVPPARVVGEELRVTYVGHATVLLQINGLNILTDPIWSDRASPFNFIGPRNHMGSDFGIDICRVRAVHRVPPSPLAPFNCPSAASNQHR